MATIDPAHRPPSPGGLPHSTEASRFKGFATFFKNYMSISAIVLAAIPIPVTQARLIPTFKAQQGMLSVYSSLMCFLAFSLVFFWRHSFARRMFPIRGPREKRVISRLVPYVPLVFIILTVFCILSYHYYLSDSINSGKLMYANLKGYQFGEIRTSEILDSLEIDNIYNITFLTLSYIGIFLFSELALSVMALKEYLQDLLQQDDLTLIANHEIRLTADRKPGKAAADA
jgi:hypothetical protein